MTDMVKVICDECNAVVELELETEEVGREERHMGAEVEYETSGDLCCDGCGNEISYSETNWEYPEGTPNHHEGPTVNGGTLVT